MTIPFASLEWHATIYHDGGMLERVVYVLAFGVSSSSPQTSSVLDKPGQVIICLLRQGPQSELFPPIYSLDFYSHSSKRGGQRLQETSSYEHGLIVTPSLICVNIDNGIDDGYQQIGGQAVGREQL